MNISRLCIAFGLCVVAHSAPVHGEPRADASVDRLIATRADPAVAKAVAEASAESPESAAIPSAGASRNVVGSMTSAQPRCSLLASAAVVAVYAACVTSAHCGTAQTAPASKPVAPSCHLVKGKLW